MAPVRLDQSKADWGGDLATCRAALDHDIEWMESSAISSC